MRIQLLGPVRAYTELDEEIPIGGPKQRAVLARLASAPGRPVSVDQLIEAVWGQDGPARAHRSLATYVSNLRKNAGLDVTGSTGSYTLDIDRTCVDLCVFEDELARLKSLSDDDSDRLRSVIDLFVGMPFADVNEHGSFTVETIRLNELRLSTLEQILDREVRRGSNERAISELEGLVADHPDRERLRGLLMRALYAAGRQTEALKVYETYRLRLQDLGLDPSPELRDLELAVLRHDDSLVRPGTTGQAEPRRRHLPVRYSSFVGRREEVDHVRTSLERRRLITIVGPGGIGKSSIALEAVRAASFPDEWEIVQTALETVDADAVDTSVAEAMGLQPGVDVDPVELITSYIGSRHCLLVLDGCEAHPAEVATMIDRLLVAAPNCRVIATSRVPLMLAGERIVRVEGLPLRDAVDLFADRADLEMPLPEQVAATVESVCEALDGMALAIELAAARARSIPLGQLASRIDSQMPLLRRPAGMDGRHDSMARAIQWSTDLLTEAERRAYRWLSVFSTGFRLRDANGLLASRDVEDLVARLVEVSLLQPADDNAEYRYLEPIRQHAAHALDEAGEREAARAAHARWMVEAARNAFLDEWSPRRRAMRTWLFRRRSEFLDAVRWSSGNGHPDLAIAIFAAIGKIVWSFEDIGHILHPMTRALDDPEATPSPELAIALADAAWALKAYDRPDDAHAFVERAEAIVASFDGESLEELTAKGTVIGRRAILDCPEIVREGDLELADQAIALLERAQAPNAGSFIINRANLLYRLHRISDANQAHESADAWFLSTTGRPSPLSLNHRALVRAEHHGEWEAALDDARTAAQIQFDDHDNVGAIGSYYLMGYISMISGRSLAEPAAHMRHMARITGTHATFMIEMYFRSERGETTSVMRLAKWWFRIRTWHTVDNIEYINNDMELTILGDERSMPRHLVILLPVARALESAGRTDDARYIVREIPGLMDQARLDNWGVIDFLGFFDDLRERLDVGEPHGVTLKQMFDWVREVVDTYPIDTEQDAAFGDPPEDQGAPPTFTRIRDV